MAYVKCVDCEFVGQKANAAGESNPVQRCEKSAPEANQADEGLARYPIVELSDGGCHEGKAVPPRPKESDKPEVKKASAKPAKKDGEK